MADSLVSRFGCYTIIWDTTSALSIVHGSPVVHSRRPRGQACRPEPTNGNFGGLNYYPVNGV
jgi:hypothetical protein